MSDWVIELRTQLIALLTFFIFPIILYLWLKVFAWKKGRAEIWYLPAHQCCRLVVRNLPHRKTLYDIRYRVFLREVVPASTGSSVESYRDTLLHDRDELFLFPEDDQVLVSFRIKGTTEAELMLVITNKFGVVEGTYPLKNVSILVADYAATLKNLFNFDVRIAKRAEVTSATLRLIWSTLTTSPVEQCFYPSQLRHVG